MPFRTEELHLDFDGFRMRCTVLEPERPAATLVLLHGYTDAGGSWDLAAPLLAQRARCVIPDQRGHGGSPCASPFGLNDLAADAVTLLERIRDRSSSDPTTLVGHSMGTFVARAAALRRPELVDRLVLVGGGPETGTELMQALKAEIHRLEGDSAPRAFIEEFQAGCVVDRGALPAGFFDARVRDSALLPLRWWRELIDGLAAPGGRSELARVSRPTLVMGGAQDSVFSETEQRELAASIPGARLLLYRDCGHSPHWEHPERFAADLLAFAC